MCIRDSLSRFDGIKYGLRSGLGEDFNDLIKNSRREGFGQEVKRRIMLGNYALCSGYYDAYYKNATRIRTQIRNEYADIFSKCDEMCIRDRPKTAPTEVSPAITPVPSSFLKPLLTLYCLKSSFENG